MRVNGNDSPLACSSLITVWGQGQSVWATAAEKAHVILMKLELPPEPEESFLTPKEVARRYKVTTRTVLNWVERGDVPAIRIGKVIRFRLVEVIRAVEG